MNIVNSQSSLTDLMTTAHIQQAATWQLYGKQYVTDERISTDDTIRIVYFMVYSISFFIVGMT